MTPPLRGLYAITPDALCADPDALSAAVAAALAGGARWIQLRDKTGTPERRLRNAQALSALCRRAGAGFLVNDDVELALACGAHGVHLGADDAPLAGARRRLGATAVIGASCGPRLERARRAAAAAASYVAFGRFFPSGTKPQAPGADPAVLSAARTELRLPLCAIGGVTPANGAVLLAAGADLLAAVEGVFGNPAPEAVEASARAYAQLFDRK